MCYRSNCTLHNKSGFTFLEVMAALAITAGLLVTLLYSVNHHLKALEYHEFLTVGGILARGKLDELRSSPSKTLSSMQGGFDKPNEEYSYSFAVNTTAYDGVSEVTVTITRGAMDNSPSSDGTNRASVRSLSMKKMMRTSTLKQ